MTGRVLVVDDILANLKLLEARLAADYFDVFTAESGRQALDVLDRERIDVVLLDVMMPGLDGFEVCRRIKSTPKTAHVPVILITALDQPSDRVQGLEAGADDFLTKPVDDIALVTRVKNLTRLKTLNDEMAMRVATGATLGLASEPLGPDSGKGGRIFVVADDPRATHRFATMLAPEHAVTSQADLAAAFQAIAGDLPDLLIVDLGIKSGDALRLCSQLRSHAKTRLLPIVLVTSPGDEARLLRALDMGVNDYVANPVDRNELLARVRTQLKRKRYADHLRVALEETVELALTDPLTGLHNRRYMQTHLQTLIEEARGGERKPLSVLIADVDHFKAINDTYGHDSGDAVLRELARRLRADTREADLTCRLGGEEFVVIMPDTPADVAATIGERVRSSAADEPFVVTEGRSVPATLSVGVATLEASDTPQSLLKRADDRLYAAKRRGRNRVVTQAA